MRISIRSLLFVVTWWAWLLGAMLSGNRWLIESFTIGQYLLLAISVAIATLSKTNTRFFATCFAAGFLSWYAYLVIESLCADTSMFRNTGPGALLAYLTDQICGSDRLFTAQAKIDNYNRVLAAVRTVPGSLLGMVTYALVWFFFDPMRQRAIERTRQ